MRYQIDPMSNHVTQTESCHHVRLFALMCGSMSRFPAPD